MTIADASEAGRAAASHVILRKTTKSNVCRDKIDLPARTVLCALGAPARLVQNRSNRRMYAQVLQPGLGDVDPDPTLVVCALEQMSTAHGALRSLRDILTTNSSAGPQSEGKTAGGMFLTIPGAGAFIRLNFLMRRLESS